MARNAGATASKSHRFLAKVPSPRHRVPSVPAFRKMRRASGNSYLYGRRRVSGSRRQTKPFAARWGGSGGFNWRPGPWLFPTTDRPDRHPSLLRTCRPVSPRMANSQGETEIAGGARKVREPLVPP